MSSSPELRSPAKTCGDTRKILGPGGNRVRDSEEQKRKKEGMKKPELRTKKVAATVKPKTILPVRSNGSVDSSSSSDSSTGKVVNFSNSTGVKKPAKVVPHRVEVEAAETASPVVPVPLKRCDWITRNSGNFSNFNPMCVREWQKWTLYVFSG